MGKKIRAVATDMFFYILGSFSYCAAVTLFISPNEISPGGITGIATAINYIMGLPSGLVLFAFNVPILILGFFKMGGAFIFKTAAVTVIVSATLEITEATLKPIVIDKILASIFGGILMGVGLSLIMLRGATTGGVDIIAKLINRRYRHLTVGRLILIMDAAVIIFAALCYRNIESALYSVVAIYGTTRIMDTLLYGADRGKIIYVITDSPDAICKAVGERLHRGVTKLAARGGYTGEHRDMLMCAVRLHEVFAVYSIIDEYDKKAFIVTGEVGEIIGEGFKNRIG